MGSEMHMGARNPFVEIMSMKYGHGLLTGV